ATLHDPSYFKAHMNLACAYVLKDDFKAASKIMSDLKKLKADTELQARISILNGIIHAKRKELPKAEYYFKNASRLSRNPEIKNVVSCNSKILKGKGPCEKKQTKQFSESNKIKGIDLLYEPNIEYGNRLRIVDKDLSKQVLSFKTMGKADIFKYETEGSSTLVLIRTTDSKEMTQSNIRIGTSRKKVEEIYGKPSYQLTAGSELYMVYKASGLVFKIGSSDRVVEWAVFGIY
ncbi:MAG: hypothetical protein AAFY41_18945, partial [Bacteroidota bacterium]